MNILINTFSFPSIKDNIHDGRFVFSEAMAYVENGANVRVITPHYPGADMREQINKNITVFRFQYFFPKSLQVLKRPGLPIYNQKSYLAILQIPFMCLFFALNILKHALWADIIHAQWTVTALLSLPAKWILGKKTVLTARGSDLRLVFGWLNRFIHAKVDAAIDCFGPLPWNDQYKKSFPAHYIKLPLLVYNGASGMMPEEIKRILDKETDTFIILFIGRFDYIKININKLPLISLIHVSKTLKSQDMKFHVLYIGDGDGRIRKKMLSLIDDFGLHNHVTLLGVKTNVPDYVQYCHIGVGGVAFNAVSHEFTINGKPQILVKGDDNADTPWHHGSNAIFVEPDSEPDLANKLSWAIENRSKIKEIGENAREGMKEYIVDSKLGGMLYLKEFQRLIN